MCRAELVLVLESAPESVPESAPTKKRETAPKKACCSGSLKSMLLMMPFRGGLGLERSSAFPLRCAEVLVWVP